jgi:hypothetical protein
MGGQPRNGYKKELAQAKIDVAEYEDSSDLMDEKPLLLTEPLIWREKLSQLIVLLVIELMEGKLVQT